ncbi:DNA-3-methyladenine glycosylase 2 family protein [Thalassotalea sp. M1531]|uniref:DNA-3-methyladenine glycosylase II n=1 Tax=Thalassotalea algicola TaxID=2716224 RepID=A0A7Y0LAH7_9GAMM|nr:DNA-3-methyladenine glycosylase 2 [Thalassotalea algicola]NMP30851.1 DNA-3-methyladenine glycosylase 2 family protein [Thalassotalea algicola]
MLDPNTCQHARLSKDARFDGKFYTAVLTTGIFCRPICPARAPKEENVRYYHTAEQAQNAGYQPCKRCLPELAPKQSLPPSIEKLIDALVSDGLTVAELSEQFEMSERHIRRLFQQSLSLSPNQYLNHQRLLKARQLLTGTNIPIADVCFNSGYSSIRRFNETVKATYHETPSQIRSRLSQKLATSEISILLNYRPPFDWQGMLAFFKLRQLPGIELVSDDSYQRAITIDNACGYIEVTKVPQKYALKLKVAINDLSVLDKVIKKVRKIFDLDADMTLIHQHLSEDPLLAKQIEHYPGIRLPGCWDIFEFSIRAILGQQVSVKAATTLAGRIADKYGSGLSIEHSVLSQCFPNACQLKDADFEGIGLTQSRIDTLKRWIKFYLLNPDLLDKYHDLEQLEKQLTQLKGIGPWTVNYIAMRGLSDPNAFPASDLGVIKALSPPQKKLSTKNIIALAEQWQPWRAYATLYLWLSLKD